MREQFHLSAKDYKQNWDKLWDKLRMCIFRQTECHLEFYTQQFFKFFHFTFVFAEHATTLIG